MGCAKSLTITNISKLYELKGLQVDDSLSKVRKVNKWLSSPSKNRKRMRSRKDKGIER